MAELLLHGRELESIFELLGDRENHITYSIGWAMSRCPAFLRAILAHLLPSASAPALKVASILLQQAKSGAGITDIEIVGPALHLIVEAKRGWWLPDKAQLKYYTPRLGPPDTTQKAIVVMSECSEQYAQTRLDKTIDGFDILYMSWQQIEKLAQDIGGSHAEKRLMEELRTYLQKVIKMQDQESNLVYVVSIGSDQPTWSQISWRDIINKKGRYFSPVGRDGWPKSPPNYLGFRYDSKLLSIHHIDSWKVVGSMHDDIPEIQPTNWGPHFLYTLGPAIRPSIEVQTGKIYPNGRVWAALDLLLTSKTISEARDLTKKRRRPQ